MRLTFSKKAAKRTLLSFLVTFFALCMVLGIFQLAEHVAAVEISSGYTIEGNSVYWENENIGKITVTPHTCRNPSGVMCEQEILFESYLATDQDIKCGFIFNELPEKKGLYYYKNVTNTRPTYVAGNVSRTRTQSNVTGFENSSLDCELGNVHNPYKKNVTLGFIEGNTSSLIVCYYNATNLGNSTWTIDYWEDGQVQGDEQEYTVLEKTDASPFLTTGWYDGKWYAGAEFTVKANSQRRFVAEYVPNVTDDSGKWEAVCWQGAFSNPTRMLLLDPWWNSTSFAYRYNLTFTSASGREPEVFTVNVSAFNGSIGCLKVIQDDTDNIDFEWFHESNHSEEFINKSIRFIADVDDGNISVYTQAICGDSSYTNTSIFAFYEGFSYTEESTPWTDNPSAHSEYFYNETHNNLQLNGTINSSQQEYYFNLTQHSVNTLLDASDLSFMLLQKIRYSGGGTPTELIDIGFGRTSENLRYQDDNCSFAEMWVSEGQVSAESDVWAAAGQVTYNVTQGTEFTLHYNYTESNGMSWASWFMSSDGAKNTSATDDGGDAPGHTRNYFIISGAGGQIPMTGWIDEIYAWDDNTRKMFLYDTYNILTVEPEEFLDIPPPSPSAPLNITPATYSPSAKSNFSINWTDDVLVGKVLIEVNESGTNTNYTASNHTADIWNLTLVGVVAGTHNWRSHANDSSGNLNSSDWQSFTIASITPTDPRFPIKNSAGTTVASIDNLGNVLLNGNYSTGQSTLTPPGTSNYIIPNVTGDKQAYFNNTGSLYLRGTLTQEASSITEELNAFMVFNTSNHLVAMITNNGTMTITGVAEQNHSSP